MENDWDEITISRKEYNLLLDDSKKLWALESIGVDNWSGWDDAMALYHEDDE